MATFLKWAGIAAIGLVLVLAAAQLIQPKRTNPATDPGRTIQARLGAGSPVVAILGRACGDCHSNATTWPGYARVAPLSWIMAAAVTEGRAALNFSDWGAYSPERQRQLLAQSCRDARSGKMPGDAWTTLHPEARLSVRDIETICAAARGP